MYFVDWIEDKVRFHCQNSAASWNEPAEALTFTRYGLVINFGQSGQLEHDYESGGTGGNRFATILMYMSDLEPEDGGETVFPKGWPPNVAVEDRVDPKMVCEALFRWLFYLVPLLTLLRMCVGSGTTPGLRSWKGS